ncbi:hypothetical protein BJ973_000088 [Actinoplanes tereljensis]|nr:hypothetical protein [Actinoplanes tereljensis]
MSANYRTIGPHQVRHVIASTLLDPATASTKSPGASVTNRPW